MRTTDKEGLTRLAHCVYELIFKKGRPPVHLLLRDYARGVIEVAAREGCALRFSAQRYRPPYRSKWVPPKFSKGELKRWAHWSDDSADRARYSLYSSIMGSSDF